MRSSSTRQGGQPPVYEYIDPRDVLVLKYLTAQQLASYVGNSKNTFPIPGTTSPSAPHTYKKKPRLRALGKDSDVSEESSHVDATSSTAVAESLEVQEIEREPQWIYIDQYEDPSTPDIPGAWDEMLRQMYYAFRGARRLGEEDRGAGQPLDRV